MANKITLNRIIFFALLILPTYLIVEPIYNYMFRLFFHYETIGTSVSLSEKTPFLSSNPNFYYSFIYSVPVNLLVVAIIIWILKSWNIKIILWKRS